MGLISNTNDIDIKWEDIRDLDFDNLSKEYSEKPLLTAQDPLALSWASYEITQHNPARRWTELNMVEIHDQDVKMAEVTRKHYRDKVGVRMLKGEPLTDFQRDLYAVCIGEPLKNKHIGMIYKLPYFYTEDMQRKELPRMFDKALTRCEDNPLMRNTSLDKETITITPVTKIFKTRKSAEVREYWFKNAGGYPVCIEVTESNPLRTIIEGLYNKAQPITIKAHVRSSSKSGMLCYIPLMMELV